MDKHDLEILKMKIKVFGGDMALKGAQFVNGKLQDHPGLSIDKNEKFKEIVSIIEKELTGEK